MWYNQEVEVRKKVEAEFNVFFHGLWLVKYLYVLE